MVETNTVLYITLFAVAGMLYALRRLITKGSLKELDINELTSICKAAHGLSNGITTEPLESRHLPDFLEDTVPIKLISITHHQGVNALANNQTINFGPSLTIVYGGNAAGKSGYTRILKRACRARGSEERGG